MRATTGTSVYTLLKCRRAVALDLAGDRTLRRPLREDEEFVLQRGRDHEAVIVEQLGWPEPEYRPGAFEEGAAATEDLLRQGVVGVSQGVLLGEQQLGIPDLLRREAGGSALGDFHYVVGDIKSSARPRSDQVMQVGFYSELLATLQDRRPDYGYLLLKDGTEQRFDLEEFAPALRQVEREIEAIRSAPDSVRPFFGIGCGSCHWSEVCAPELEAGGDLSLLPGMTAAVRSALESAGVASWQELVDAPLDQIGRATRLEFAFLRRLQRSAEARQAGSPIPEARSADAAVRGAIVHVLTDPFADRLLWIGVLDGQSGRVEDAVPERRADEWGAFTALVRSSGSLLHYGGALPRWFEEAGHGRDGTLAIERRFVDLAKRLRGAATFPGPAFGLADHVRFALGRDPHRAGRASAAALAAARGDLEWLRTKGLADLEDLRDLRARLLDPAGAEA